MARYSLQYFSFKLSVIYCATNKWYEVCTFLVKICVFWLLGFVCFWFSVSRFSHLSLIQLLPLPLVAVPRWLRPPHMPLVFTHVFHSQRDTTPSSWETPPGVVHVTVRGYFLLESTLWKKTLRSWSVKRWISTCKSAVSLMVLLERVNYWLTQVINLNFRTESGLTSHWVTVNLNPTCPSADCR